MAKQPSSQSKARATSGSLEIAKAKKTRLTKAGGSSVGDQGHLRAKRVSDAGKEVEALKRKRNKERFKVK